MTQPAEPTGTLVTRNTYSGGFEAFLRMPEPRWWGRVEIGERFNELPPMPDSHPSSGHFEILSFPVAGKAQPPEEPFTGLEEVIAIAIGYEPVYISIDGHPEIRLTHRTAADRDGLVARIAAAIEASGLLA